MITLRVALTLWLLVAIAPPRLISQSSRAPEARSDYVSEYADAFDELQPLQQKLVLAIRSKDFKTVRSLLDNGLDANFTLPISSKCSTSPVALASEGGNKAILLMLLEHGTPLRDGDQCGSELSIAAFNGDDQTVAILLSHGAKRNTRDKDGFTPLLTAASNNEGMATIRPLVDSGADISATSQTGDNVLMLAAEQFNESAVEFFLNKGVDPCAKDIDGQTAADRAMIPITNDPKKLEVRKRIVELLAQSCSRK